MPAVELTCVDDFDYDKHTILVVDDNPANLGVIVTPLSDCGFQVIVARNGETAIKLAESEQPDLILLDVMLQGIDGFETCQRLKANQRTRHIMVIYMTVLTETENKVRGFGLGAVDYITKPFQQDELLARVTIHLQLKDLTENLEQKVRSQTEAIRSSNRKLQQQITESQKIETALRESESRYRTAIENSNDGIAILEQGQFVFLNTKLVDILSYENPNELVGQPVTSIFHEDDRDRVARYNRLREAGKPVPAQYEAKGITKEGKSLYLDISATRITYQDRIAVLGFFKNVTRRKHLEAQLQQAQKMEAIGTLAGGIAHDFNNILSVILGHTELAMLDKTLASGARNHMKQAMGAGRRATELVQQILTFSRQKELDRKPIKPSIVVKESLKMLRASLPSTIDIQSSIKERQAMIMANATQIQQVLMNLCTNASHAMPDQGGTLTVNLEQVSVDGTISSRLTSGPYLKLTVEDNGHGMDRATLDRIFDPYFTTKEQGEGTGLGLAVVHGIVNNYNGDIQVQSEPGSGTRFDVWFPVTQEKNQFQDLEIVLDDLPSGTERILYVDDEELVASLYEKMLQHLGYHVTATTSSMKAWQLFQAHPTDFDLVITDLTMPQMTGDILSQNIIQLRPDIPIILCTGYSDRLTKGQARDLGIREYLLKPLIIQQLAHTIRKVLGKEPTHQDT